MRGKLTDVCIDASGIRNERPKFLVMIDQCMIKGMKKKRCNIKSYARAKYILERIFADIIVLAVFNDDSLI